MPGIRYVVDPGTARISRYSARLKVQRLPIEPISQASADQRKGRCGRVADGICDPALLRGGLRGAPALHRPGDPAHEPRLGDPADGGRGPRRHRGLPVPRPARPAPGPRRHPAAAGARRARRAASALTPLGRRLAQLPVDPRLGRMVLEADRLGCAEEVIVIVAALSIQDPRERPAEKREQADQLHARFKDEASDFLAYVNLWRYLREQQRALSRQPVPQALPRRVPAPPARARVAGPRRAAAPGGEGRRRSRFNQRAGRARRDPRRAALRPALAPRAARRRAARLPRRARRALRALARLGAGPEAADLGHGRRAGRDVAAVGPDRARSRPALGRAARAST